MAWLFCRFTQTSSLRQHILQIDAAGISIWPGYLFSMHFLIFLMTPRCFSNETLSCCGLVSSVSTCKGAGIGAGATPNKIYNTNLYKFVLILKYNFILAQHGVYLMNFYLIYFNICYMFYKILNFFTIFLLNCSTYLTYLSVWRIVVVAVAIITFQCQNTEGVYFKRATVELGYNELAHKDCLLQMISNWSDDYFVVCLFFNYI